GEYGGRDFGISCTSGESLRVSTKPGQSQSVVDGRRWHRIPGTDRPTAIGMFEHRDSNPHIHASIYAPPRYVEFLRSGAAQELWSSCHPRCGQLDLAPVRSAKQRAGYQIKDARGPNALDNMMLYVPTVRRR
ncbi:MAG: hypothetical protein ACKVQR_21260, partial [Aquabacterium sp.]